MTAIVAIPARLKSTRFPRKVLADIFGHPMLWHVHQAVAKAERISEVWVLTDSQEVLDAASGWGAKTLMTSEHCPSGTDRIASVVDSLGAEIIVNVQADEPLIDPKVVDRLVEALEGSEADKRLGQAVKELAVSVDSLPEATTGDLGTGRRPPLAKSAGFTLTDRPRQLAIVSWRPNSPTLSRG